MSDIELILAKLKIVCEEEQEGMYLCDREHSKILLDYITNLQEENKELKEDKSKMFETAVKNNNKLMDRIYNAIEYIDNMDANYWNEGHKYNFDFDKLLEILKGSDKE